MYNSNTIYGHSQNLNVFSSVKVEGALNYQNKSPTHIYAWTYYPYETIHTFTRSPQVGDFAFAFNSVEHGFKVDLITKVITDEYDNVITIIVRGGTFDFQCGHTIDVGEFSSAHVIVHNNVNANVLTQCEREINRFLQALLNSILINRISVTHRNLTPL